MTGDAQALYAELVKTYEDPLTKDLTRKELKDKLEAHTIPSNWSKSLESWILSWEHKVQDLEDAMNAALPSAQKTTLFEDAIRSHEKLQPAIQQSRVTQETIARMTGATSADMGFDAFCEFVLNLAKEIDNAEAKKKVHKALKLKLNQHQQGRGKGGKGSGSYQCPAWKDDPDLADCICESIPGEKWKAMSQDDQKKHAKKEKKC